MFSFLNNVNFYVSLSFLSLVLCVIWKGKQIVMDILDKRIISISKRITDGAQEKEKALLELTHANQAVSRLPDDVAKVWEKHTVDFQEIQSLLDQEVTKEEKVNKQRLLHIQHQLLRAEYHHIVSSLCEQFQYDMQNSTQEEQRAILYQAIDLLDSISPDQMKNA